MLSNKQTHTEDPSLLFVFSYCASSKIRCDGNDIRKEPAGGPQRREKRQRGLCCCPQSRRLGYTTASWSLLSSRSLYLPFGFSDRIAVVLSRNGISPVPELTAQGVKRSQRERRGSEKAEARQMIDALSNSEFLIQSTARQRGPSVNDGDYIFMERSGRHWREGMDRKGKRLGDDKTHFEFSRSLSSFRLLSSLAVSTVLLSGGRRSIRAGLISTPILIQLSPYKGAWSVVVSDLSWPVER